MFALMKVMLIVGLIGVILFSCRKERYLHFTEKQLVFVNYIEGQSIKFIDTAAVVQTLVQKAYERKFSESIGIAGKTGNFTEEYKVNYYASYNSDLDLYINMKGPLLELSFASYGATYAFPDSLTYTYPTLTINGKEYNEVYILKLIKNRPTINKNDTATLFHNKEFGVIQLLFPNGKKIVRID
jgi:hypothetical protein